MIKVTNRSSENPIRVAISRWAGHDEDTRYFFIPKGEFHEWQRGDLRGFVMSLVQRGAVTPYYLYVGSDVVVGDSQVTNNGVAIEPADKSTDLDGVENLDAEALEVALDGNGR